MCGRFVSLNKKKIIEKSFNISKSKNLKSLCIGYKNSDLKIISHKFIKCEQKVKFLLNNNCYSFSTQLIGKIQIKNIIEPRATPVCGIQSKISSAPWLLSAS